MSTLSQNFSNPRTAASALDSGAPATTFSPACPACRKNAQDAAVERYGNHELFQCASCGLQFWEPRVMPEARWYEQMYSGRDEKLMPLEPGHRYFLGDPLAPGGGDLLDIGCGTGNFLAAARDTGYAVSGTELDRSAARFAREQLGLPRVLGLTVSEFSEKYPGEKFDVVTFFEVLEHQAAPVDFVEKVKSCLRPRGYIALSVPNRDRWLTGPDVLDYPPNHFLRWNAAALRGLLSAHGFEVLSVKEQPAGIVHAAQMINMSLRTGLSRKSAGGAAASFRDVMQMAPQEAAAALRDSASGRRRAMQFLGRMKYLACFPVAIAAYPYVRLRGYKGTYLYLLARLLQ
jgi:2-polyprenyl-3-methyl-5-hydroxy-6-metoxy-1,4-benzoquinol methylase